MYTRRVVMSIKPGPAAGAGRIRGGGHPAAARAGGDAPRRDLHQPRALRGRTHAGKRILKIGVYRPGDLASEVTALDDVDVRAEGDRALFTGHATVKSRFKGRDFGSLYRLSKMYENRQGRWRIIASKTARLGDE